MYVYIYMYYIFIHTHVCVCEKETPGSTPDIDNQQLSLVRTAPLPHLC